MQTETVLIKTSPCEGNPTGLVLINKSDFDPAKHTLAEPAPAEAAGALEQGSGDAASGSAGVAWEDYTNAELKEYLDSKGVKYHRDDNKARLVELCKGA